MREHTTITSHERSDTNGLTVQRLLREQIRTPARPKKKKEDEGRRRTEEKEQDRNERDETIRSYHARGTGGAAERDGRKKKRGGEVFSIYQLDRTEHISVRHNKKGTPKKLKHIKKNEIPQK